MEKTNRLRSQLERVKMHYDAACRVVCEERKRVLEAQDHAVYVYEAQGILQSIAQAVQQEAHHRIASVVTRSLDVVFDDPYEFRIAFQQKRGKTEAQLLLARESLECDPMQSVGGGVIDVAAFALRLSCMALSRPKTRSLLVLDEPFKFVSAEYHDRVRRLLETLAEELEIQIIMVTHVPQLRTGKVVEI